MRYRPLVVLTAVLAAAVPAGCSDDKAAKQAPTAAPAPSSSAEMPPDQVTETKPAEPGVPSGATQMTGRNTVAAGGYGSLAIGDSQAELTDADLLEGIRTASVNCVTATGVLPGGEAGVVFASGRLSRIRVADTRAKTAEGIRVGTAAADVRAQYPSGRAVSSAGGGSGWYVAQAPNALLFELEADRVTAINAGVAESLEKTWTTGQGC